MKAKEFDALRPRLGRLSVDTVMFAREVLVDGQKQADVARTHGLTRQRVSGMVQRVLAAAQGFPSDWEKVEVWLPPTLAKKVRKMEADAVAEVRTGKES